MLPAVCTFLCFSAAIAYKASTSNNKNVKVISRSGWGASEPKIQTAFSEVPQLVVIHHTATQICLTTTSCKSSLREIQKLHMEKREFDDIGYNFLIGGDGQIYEGRGWDKIGAHARGSNSKSIGISLIGNYMNEQPREAALAAIQQLIARGVEAGKLHPDYQVVGHRDVRNTLCPGDNLYNVIQQWSRFKRKNGTDSSL